MVYEVSLYPPRRPAQPSLGLIQLPAGQPAFCKLSLFTFVCIPVSTTTPSAPISGGSRDLVPYNRRTGLRHSGLSCVSVGNHTLTLVFLTQAELMQRVSHAIDMPVVPTLYQLCTLQAAVFSCDQQ